MRISRAQVTLILLVWLVVFLAAALLDRHVAQWVRSVHPLQSHEWLRRMLKWPGTFWFTLVIAAMVVLFHRRSIRAAAPLLLSGPLVGICYLMMKWAVGRHRPVIIIQPFDLHPFARGFAGLVHAESGLSFPSGHAAMAFATATCLSAILPRGAALFFLVAIAVAAERVLENSHYLSDVTAGAGTGILCGWAAVVVSRVIFATRSDQESLSVCPHPNPLPEGEGEDPHPNPLPEGEGEERDLALGSLPAQSDTRTSTGKS